MWIGLQDTLLTEEKQVAEKYGQHNTKIKSLNAQK